VHDFFQVGYPDDLAYKLYDRRAKILVLFRLENYFKIKRAKGKELDAKSYIEERLLYKSKPSFYFIFYFFMYVI
jgi:hypothetical protein